MVRLSLCVGVEVVGGYVCDNECSIVLEFSAHRHSYSGCWYHGVYSVYVNIKVDK